MSNILNQAVLQALRDGRAAFFSGDAALYSEQMQIARAAIEAIEAMGIPMDGSTGRPMETLGLRGEYAIQAALPLLRTPAQALQQYRIADTSLISLFKSQVVSREDPWLPSLETLLDFFCCGDSDTDALTDTLDKAAALYGKLTNGGGGGVAALYRAELAQQRGNYQEAKNLARQAHKQMTGDQWMKPIIGRILQN